MTSNTERGSVASLNCLHTEILEMICNYLWDDWNPGPLEGQVHNKPLAALASTSKRLWSIATPILYKDPGGAIPFGALIRLLDNRPDIRGYIKHLDLPDPLACSRQDFKYFKDVAQRLSMEIESDKDFEKAQKTDVSMERFCAELLLALSSEVETLVLHNEEQLQSEKDGEETSFSFLASRFQRLGKAAHFQKLRELHFSFGNCRDGYSIGNPGVAAILGAAPRLETLIFDSTFGLREGSTPGNFSLESFAPALRNLETLVFWNAVFEDDNQDLSFGLVRDMATTASKLKSFTFYFSLPFLGDKVSRHFISARFLEALKPRRDTLEVLDLDLTDIDMLHNAGEPLIKRSDLVQFSRLHTLRLHDACFCLHRGTTSDLATAMVSDEPYHCLTGILPSTVRVLSLRIRVIGGDDYWPAWGDVIHLGRRRVAGHFRNLEKVRVTAKFNFNGREEAFQGSGVNVSLQSDGYFGNHDDEEDDEDDRDGGEGNNEISHTYD